MNRNRTILALLMGILALCVLYAYFATPRLEKAPPRKPARYTKVASTDARKISSAAEGRIDFTYMDVERQEYAGSVRDLFNFGGKRKPVVSVPKEIKPVVERPPIAPPVQVQAPPVDIVTKSLSKFTFVGFLEKGGEKTIFLSSSGEMFLVKSGERFGVDQEFLVKEIEGNLLRIKHKDREGLIELELIEQQKLNSAVSAPAKGMSRPVGAAQAQTRFFTPKKRTLHPAIPQGGSSFPEMNHENNPEVEQELEAPEQGEGLEGEVDGTNQ